MNRVLRRQETLDGEATDGVLPAAEVQAEVPAEAQPVAELAEALTGEDQQTAEEPAEAVEEQGGGAAEAVAGEAVAEEQGQADVIAMPGAAGASEEVSGEPELNPEHLRMTEAFLFAASEPLSDEALKSSLPEGAALPLILQELKQFYEKRGVNLVRVAEKWQFRTAPDLAFLLRREKPEQKRLSRAAIETLAIIAYHQPVTRAEIEDIRGVMLSKGTLDTLMEIGWIKIRGRKRTPGRPVTYGTTEAFLVQFGLENISHLPGMEELKAAGFLEAVPPAGLDVPTPSDQMSPEEDPYDGEDADPSKDLATGGADPFMPGS
jgi:segregation and condensation protein B